MQSCLDQLSEFSRIEAFASYAIIGNTQVQIQIVTSCFKIALMSHSERSGCSYLKI